MAGSRTSSAGTVPMPGSQNAEDEAQAKSIEERLLEDTEAWRPEAGESIIGLVVDIGRRTSKFGAYPAVTIRKDDGDEVVFHAFRTVAKSELSRSRPVQGDRIGVLYIGPQEGQDYHGYRIRLDRATGGRDFNWEEFDPVFDASPPATTPPEA